MKAINDLLVERDLDVYIHVDAASGGFVAPFVNPSLEWDFRLPKVVSINVSGHKYGLVRPLRFVHMNPELCMHQTNRFAIGISGRWLGCLA